MKGFCYGITEASWISELEGTTNKTVEFLYDLRDGMKLIDELPVNNS